MNKQKLLEKISNYLDTVVNVEISKLKDKLVSDKNKWKICYSLLKNSENSSYRVLFKDNKKLFLNSLENKNSKSYVLVYFNT